jgi:hypothetical protein
MKAALRAAFSVSAGGHGRGGKNECFRRERQEQCSQSSWGLDLLQAMLVRRPNMMDDLVVHGLLYELGWLSTAGIVGMIVTIVAPLAIPRCRGAFGSRHLFTTATVKLKG